MQSYQYVLLQVGEWVDMRGGRDEGCDGVVYLSILTIYYVLPTCTYTIFILYCVIFLLNLNKIKIEKCLGKNTFYFVKSIRKIY